MIIRSKLMYDEFSVETDGDGLAGPVDRSEIEETTTAIREYKDCKTLEFLEKLMERTGRYKLEHIGVFRGWDYYQASLIKLGGSQD